MPMRKVAVHEQNGNAWAQPPLSHPFLATMIATTRSERVIVREKARYD
jgi:hypothetical protein